MPAALLAMSHSPLLHHNPPAEEVQAELDAQFAAVKKFVRDYDPDEIVVFWPDHFNGFFYELMPAFCIGFEAFGTGDYDSFAGDLNVPTTVAEELAQFVLNQDVDIAISRKMEVDLLLAFLPLPFGIPSLSYNISPSCLGLEILNVSPARS